MHSRVFKWNTPSRSAVTARLGATGCAMEAAGATGLFSVQIVITPSARATSRKSLDLRADFGLTSPANGSSPFFRELRDRTPREEQVR